MCAIINLYVIGSFLCLQRVKYRLLRHMNVISIISIIYVPMHLHTDDGDDCNEPFSLIIAVQILTAEPLDKHSRKSYNTTTLMG